MNTTPRHEPSPRVRPSGGLAELGVRLTLAETVPEGERNISSDTATTAGEGAVGRVAQERVGEGCRPLTDSMNEGMVVISDAAVIHYANPCFAQMVQCTPQQAASGSFSRFLSPADDVGLQRRLKTDAASGIKMAVMLRVGDGSQVPVQLSARTMASGESGGLRIGIVITDLTLVRQTEELLRGLANRVIQSQEDERGRLALELHDNITQLLCAILFRSQALAEKLSARGGKPRNEALSIRDMLSETAKEVERISHGLRSSVLNELGLVPVLRDVSREFSRRTGVAVDLDLSPLARRLPAGTELALYRILQHALANVEGHAEARHVFVALKRHGAFLRLQVRDDGIGFDHSQHDPGTCTGFGLLGMRERAAYVGGTFEVRSVPEGGTVVEVNVPVGVADIRPRTRNKKR